MKLISKDNTWPDTWVEFTGAELKKFYRAHDSYFVCSAIKAEYKKVFGVEMHPASEPVILSIRNAVPNRFKKRAPETCKNVLGAWLLKKYAYANNCRHHVISQIPDDYVFTIPMYVQRQG
jgi:hypothetical protein